MMPTCVCRLHRGNGFWHHFCLGEGCLSSPAPEPDNFVPFFMFLAPFKLLPQFQSPEGTSPYVSPLRGTPAAPVALCLSQLQSLLIFTASVMETFLPGTTTLGWGTWYWAEPPHSQWGTSTAEISLLTFKYNMWMWDQSNWCLCLYYKFSCGFFSLSFVTELLFCQTSGES